MKGDAVKTLGVNGSSIILSGGFLKSTTKRATAILYSLFASDWIGNLFVTGDAVLKSSFQDLHARTATLDALLDISDSAEESLSWLVRKGDVKAVVAATRLIEGGTFLTQIRFTEKDDTTTEIEVWKYPQYWEVRGDI